VTDDAERTVNLRPDAGAGREGAAVAPADPHHGDARDDANVYGKPARSERTIGRDLAAAGFLAVVLTAIGLPAAMLWQILTPRVEFVVVEGGARHQLAQGAGRVTGYFS